MNDTTEKPPSPIPPLPGPYPLSELAARERAGAAGAQCLHVVMDSLVGMASSTDAGVVVVRLHALAPKREDTPPAYRIATAFNVDLTQSGDHHRCLLAAAHAALTHALVGVAPCTSGQHDENGQCLDG